MQTRKQSLVEIVTGTVVGFILAWGLLWLLSMAFGWHNTGSRNTLAVLCFTALSLARSYAIRRYFNWRHQPARRLENPAEIPERSFFPIATQNDPVARIAHGADYNDSAAINDTLSTNAPSPVPWGGPSVK